MVGAREHPRVSRRGQVYKPSTLRFIPTENKGKQVDQDPGYFTQGPDPPAFLYFP